RPTNRETADHSIPYTAAVALMFGTVEQEHFQEKYFLNNKELLDLVAKVKCTASDEANQRDAETYLCDLDLTLRSGERKSTRVEYHRGHWRNPMSDAEVETKFRSLVTPLLSRERCDRLLYQLWKLEEVSDLSALMQLTVL